MELQKFESYAGNNGTDEKKMMDCDVSENDMSKLLREPTENILRLKLQQAKEDADKARQLMVRLH